MRQAGPLSEKISTLGRLLLVLIAGTVMSACTTVSVEGTRATSTGLLAGEGVVIMARSYHLGNKTEEKFISCVGNSVGRGSSGLRVVPNDEFTNAVFPWLEPRTAPPDIKGLSAFMSRPGVAEKINDLGIRYVGWIDGDTDKVASGGSMSCAAGPGGGGCFGFAWWTNDAKYEATVWDLTGLESAGTVSTDVSGTSFVPALIIPIPLIARAQSKACNGLADQLKLFIVPEEAA